MPIVVRLNAELFGCQRRLAVLTAMAARDELVLVGVHQLMVGGQLAVLSRTLAPRRTVALLVNNDRPSMEWALVDDLLNDGVIPVVLAVAETPAIPRHPRGTAG